MSTTYHIPEATRRAALQAAQDNWNDHFPCGPRRYAVGEKVAITEATLATMHNSNRSCVTPNYPSDDFIAKARACLGVVGEVTHVFAPGYEVTARFGEQSFHMKDNWIKPARLVAA